MIRYLLDRPTTSCPFSSRTRNIKMTHLNKRQKRTHGCAMPNITCDRNSPWRTADGSCNNLDNPTWGMSDLPQRRLLPAAYDDGKTRGGRGWGSEIIIFCVFRDTILSKQRDIITDLLFVCKYQLCISDWARLSKTNYVVS